MAKQVFLTLKLDGTGQAVNSVKELKDVIKQLKKDLESTKDANAYAKIETQIKQAHVELKNFNRSLQEGKSFSEKITSSIKEGFAGIGATIVATFALDKIIDFGKECIKSFGEAELSAQKLKTAVGVNGGLQKDFEKLSKQAEDLQRKTIFSDDAIEQAQTLALQFGLTTKQVEDLIPAIVDYASATGQELLPALEGILKGTDGSARALKAYGINIEDTGSKVQNLTNLTEQLNLKFKGQAELIASDTQYGQLQKLGNQYDELKEKVGGFISGFLEAGATITNFALNGFKPLDDGFDDVGSSIKGASQELKAFHDNFLNFQIDQLQQQITQLQNLGSSTTDLENRLKLLKQQKLEVELSSKSDADIIKAKNALEELKKSKDQFAQVKFFNEGGNSSLEALNKEIEKRHLEALLTTKDYNKLTNDELKKSKKELEGINSIAADDEIEKINKVLDARQKAVEKAKQLSEAFWKKSKQDVDDWDANANKTIEDMVKSMDKAADDARKNMNGPGREEYEKAKTELAKIDFKLEEEHTKKVEEEAKKRAEIEQQSIEMIADSYTNTILGMFSISNQESQMATQANIENIHTQLDEQLSAIDIQQQKEEGTFVEKTSTQKKFDAERKKLREKAAADEKKLKREQAKADQENAIIQSIIATQVAAIKALPNIPLAIATEIAGAAATALIAAQPLVYQQGGILEGNSHANGGIPAIVGNSYPVELEGGEIILNKNVSAIPHFRQLASDINVATGGVAFASPSFAFGGSVSPMTKFAYDSGGQIPSNKNVNVTSQIDFSELKSFLAAKLDQPMKAYVVESEITGAQQVSRTIERRASFN